MIVKNCKIHGALTIEQVNKNGNNSFKCKACHKEFAHNHYLKNKEKVAIRTKEWREDNLEKKRALNRKYWHENRDHYKKLRRIRDLRDKKSDPDKFRIACKNRKRKNRLEMSDGYVRQVLKRSGKFPVEHISNELLVIKRVCIAIRRKHKQITLIGEINEQVK